MNKTIWPSLWRLSCACVLSLALGVASASASTFDAQTGRLSLEDADYGVSFDSATAVPAELRAAFYDAEGAQLGPVEVGALFQADASGLEGTGALRMGGSVSTLALDVAPLEAQFGGRRVEIRIWQRPLGTRLRITLAWSVAGAAPEAEPFLLGAVVFQPTSRVTDDGWEEWTSGPLDFLAGGAIAPATLTLTDSQQDGSPYAVFAPDLRVSIDALEVIDLGPALVPVADCAGLTMESDCGGVGYCLLGRCVDGALGFGAKPEDPTLRDDYLDRRLFEYETFEGGRLPRSLMSALVDAVQQARQRSAAHRFWDDLRRGVDALRDGHAIAPTPQYRAQDGLTNLGVCIHLGEADLLPSPGPAPLVFSVDATENPVGSQLQVGDVLVAIDGVRPEEWMGQVPHPSYHQGDPSAAAIREAPFLLRQAAVLGSTLTFERCARSGPAPAPCTPGEVTSFDIDLAAVWGDPVWAGELPAWSADAQQCDYRFRRAVDTPEARELDFAGYADEGGVRTLLFNNLPHDSLVPQWRDTVLDALDPPPDYLIVDQRLGRGGYRQTTDFLMGMLLTEDDFDRMLIVPHFERPLDATLRAVLEACHSQWEYTECASYITWELHEIAPVSQTLRGVAGAIPVAVLNGTDGSCSDFTAKLFTYRSGPTRQFGGAVTMGAFGPPSHLGAHLGELFSGSLQSWDMSFLATAADDPDAFNTGYGVPPDVWVLQRQSDALLGVDTTVEAAKAWLQGM